MLKLVLHSVLHERSRVTVTLVSLPRHSGGSTNNAHSSVHTTAVAAALHHYNIPSTSLLLLLPLVLSSAVPNSTTAGQDLLSEAASLSLTCVFTALLNESYLTQEVSLAEVH
jgi:hypothetical protein